MSNGTLIIFTPNKTKNQTDQTDNEKTKLK